MANKSILEVARMAATVAPAQLGRGEQGISTMTQRSISTFGESDEDAIKMAAAAGLTKEFVNDIWDGRFECSPSIQAEFGEVSHYRAYMNALAAGRVKIFRGKVR